MFQNVAAIVVEVSADVKGFAGGIGDGLVSAKIVPARITIGKRRAKSLGDTAAG